MSTATGHKKNLAYYMELPYKLHIDRLQDDNYYAHYYELGTGVAHGDAPTLEGAVREADISKELLFEIMLEDGDNIPEPRHLDRYSGKFIVRTPKSLHKKLSERAEEEGVSLNQLVVSLLSGSVAETR